MTSEQKEIFRLLLTRLMELAAAEEWSDEELIECVLELEDYIDGLIEAEIFALLNTLDTKNYGLN
jgi:hypothetical protein